MNFKIRCLFVFILMNEGNSTSAKIDKDAKRRDELCSKNARLFWDFTWQYFKDRHAVRLLANKDASLGFSNAIIRCSMDNSQLSVQYDTSIWDITEEIPRRKLRESDVYYHHDVNGLIFITEFVENIKGILQRIDPQTKAVVILMNVIADDVSDVLTSAWSRYKLLDLVVFHTDRNIDELKVYVYDPFVIINDIRGFVHTHTPSNTMNDDTWAYLLRIIDKRLMNFNGYPVTIVTVPMCDYDLYQFLCKLINTVTEYMNYECVHLYAEWDYQLVTWSPNKTEIGEADIAFTGMLPIGRDRLEQQYSEFLFAIGKEEFGFITFKIPSSSTVSFTKIFTPGASIALVFCFFATVMAWRWLQKFDQDHMKKDVKIMDFMKICCIILGNFLLMSQPDIRERGYERCLLITWICFSMFVCWHYQATMVMHLTAGGPSRDIETIEELADSDLRIFFEPHQRRMTEQIADSEGAPYIYSRLLKRVSSEVVAHAKDNMAQMCHPRDCEIIRDNNLNPVGEPRFHSFVDPGLDRYTSFLVPVDSPYKESFNRILMMISERGLLMKWKYDMDLYLYLIKRRLQRQRGLFDRDLGNDVYKMKDLTFIFWSWFGCCCFCSLIFLGELLWVYISRIANELPMILLTPFSR